MKRLPASEHMARMLLNQRVTDTRAAMRAPKKPLKLRGRVRPPGLVHLEAQAWRDQFR